MTVVADTSPLNYLRLIEELHVLPQLFGEILVPAAVVTELSDPLAPVQVSDWIRQPPPWLLVSDLHLQPRTELHDLDFGESHAIELALQVSAGLLLIDDAAGRRTARHLGIAVTGTLGILQRAAQLSLIDLAMAISKLEHTNFRLTPTVKRSALNR